MTHEHIEEKVEEVTAPGLLLQVARKEQQLSLEDISSRLRLRVEVLEQIEADQFDMGKLATFTRGYYRSYAKLVNVPEADVLSALDQLGKAKIEEHDMQSFSRKTKREKHDNRIMKLTWVIFALILSMSVLWWWQEQQQLETVEVSSVGVVPTEEIEIEENALIDTNVLPVVEEITSQEPAQEPKLEILKPEQQEKNSESVTTQVVKVAEAVEVPKEEPKSTTLTEVIEIEDVAMTFSNDCWLQIKDASNERLYSGVKKANQTLKLTGKAPYKLIIGAPSAVTLTYKGKPVDLSAYPAGKVARLTLPQ